MLTVEKLQFAYGDLQVLWGIDLEVKTGEIVTVVGANGAGKSTVLKNVSRLVKPMSGRILFDGEELGGLHSHQVVERGVVLQGALKMDGLDRGSTKPTSTPSMVAVK